VPAGGGIYELDVDAYLIADAAHTTFEHVLHRQLLRDLLHLHRLTFVGEHRIARDHKQPREFRQIRNQVFGHTVNEVLLLWIITQVNERKHGNGWLFR